MDAVGAAEGEDVGDNVGDVVGKLVTEPCKDGNPAKGKEDVAGSVWGLKRILKYI